jgi:hypothetical protein
MSAKCQHASSCKGLLTLDGLRSLGHWSGLYPSLDVVLDGDLEHLLNVTGGSNERTSQRATKKSPRHERRDTRITQTNEDHVSTRLKERQVQAVDRHVLLEGSAEEDIEETLVLLYGSLCILGSDESIGTELLNGLALRVGVGDGIGLGSESLGELETEMAETTDTDDSDTLAGTGTVVLERRVASDTSAEHGSGVGALESLGDANGEATLAGD